MSNLVHCDGPDCENTEPDERRLCDAPWLRVEQGGGASSLDFCSRDCLAAWSKAVGPADGDDRPCRCSPTATHTASQHNVRATVVDGR